MADLLLELFSEEIPARMQNRAAQDLQKLVQEQLFAAGFMPEGAKAFATPRRLSLVVTGIPAASPDRQEEKKGPRVGAPERAVEGFLKSAGLSSVDECEVRSDKKGEFYVAVINEKGRATADVIAGFMPELIRKFPWPKSMRWGDGALNWVRPLHSILCVFDGEVVDFEIDGLASSDKTYGHRFMAPAEIQTHNFESYQLELTRAKVVLDQDQRREQIGEEARALCKAQGLELVEDNGLLSEVAGLAEWPVTLMGSFDEKFLALPDEVLTSTMKGHQKYFSVRNPQTGGLTNKFIFVSNIEAPDGGEAMRQGYERVLTARLSDAWFLYQQDLQVPLADHAKKLSDVTFFEGLGTIGDKVERISALAREIAPLVGADADKAEEAARLAKADLVTGMVYEFPELQGLMGRYYAEVQGLDAAIANASFDHYKPAGQGDDVPTGPVSAAVALADKIDTLTSFWAIDKKPTGSKDPFALRRAALGVIQIVLWKGDRLSLRPSLGAVLRRWCDEHLSKIGNLRVISYNLSEGQRSEADNHINQLEKNFGFWEQKSKTEYCVLEQASYESWANPKAMLVDCVDPLEVGRPTRIGFIEDQFNWSYPNDIDALNDLLAFFHDRLKVYLKDKGHAHDHVDAVRLRADGTLEDDLVLIVKKLEALEAFLKTDDGANLTAAYKRAGNILKAEAKKDGAAITQAPDEALYAETAEKALGAAANEAASVFTDALAAEDFAKAMTALAALRAPLDQFFEDVTVNADDADLRRNRLALLTSIKATCEQVADFSQIEG